VTPAHAAQRWANPNTGGGGWQAQTLISNPMSVHPKYSRIRSLWMGGGQDPFVIEIFTDEGVSGFCANYGGGEFACAVIEKHFKRFLIGQDPFNIELIWDQMNRSTLPYGLGGVTSMAMAGVDIALYDLVAKVQKLPVYKMLGGQTKENIPCYVTIHPDYVDSWRDRGFLGVKIAAPWGVESGRAGIKNMEQLIAKLRKNLGDDMEIMIDCYLSWDIEFATRVAERVRDYDVKWFEDPLQNGWATENNRILRDRISPILLATATLNTTQKRFTTSSTSTPRTSSSRSCNGWAASRPVAGSPRWPSPTTCRSSRTARAFTIITSSWPTLIRPMPNIFPSAKATPFNPSSPCSKASRCPSTARSRSIQINPALAWN
jgi:hypothetical protein